MLALPADADPLLSMKFCPAGGHRHSCLPVSMSVDEEMDPPAGHHHGQADPLQGAFDRPPGIAQPIWVHEVWDLLVAHGAVEFAEEGPIIYLRSHYISHRHHKANRASRPLRFDTDFETWEADVRFMWEDFVDASALDLVFIAPEPPSSPTVGTCGTVLVIQHPAPGQAACLVTHPGPGDHSTNNEIALSLATPCTSDFLLHSAGLASFCAQQELQLFVVCELLVGSIVRERDRPLQIHDGLGLRVRLRNIQASELVQSVSHLRETEDVDDVQLWMHQWSVQSPAVHKSQLQSQAQDLQDCLTRSSRVLDEEEASSTLTPLAIPGEAPVEEPTPDRFPADHEYIIDSWRRAADTLTATETLEGEVTVKFVTWFLNGDRWSRCDAYRVIALPLDTDRWDALFRHLWRDRSNHDEQLHVSLVYPSVVPDNHGGHLILHQNLGPTVRGVLLSVFWHGQESELGSRFAQVVPHWLSFQRFLQFADLLEACRRRLLLCVGFSGSQSLDEDRPLFPRHGSHVEIHVAEWQVADETTLMQHPGAPHLEQPTAQPASDPEEDCDASLLNADAPIFVSGLPWNIGSMSELTQDLHALWENAAFSWEDETPSGPILVWFVDHQWLAPHGRVARLVQLYDDYQNWEDRIRRAWADHIVEGAVIEFHLVSPHPPRHNDAVFAHVVLVQRPNEAWVTSIVSCVDRRRPQQVIQQLAVTTHEHILLDNLLRVLGLHEACFGPRAQLQCDGWYSSVQLWPGRPIPWAIRLQQSSLIHSQTQSDEDEPETKTDATVAVKLRSGCDTLLVPEYIECLAPGESTDIETELQLWGLTCSAFRFGSYSMALCFPKQWSVREGQFHYMFCNEDLKDPNGAFLHTSDGPLDDLGLMQLLYKFGYCRAAILHTEDLLSGLQRITFLDVVPQHGQVPDRPKRPLPWPGLPTALLSWIYVDLQVNVMTSLSRSAFLRLTLLLFSALAMMSFVGIPLAMTCRRPR